MRQQRRNLNPTATPLFRLAQIEIYIAHGLDYLINTFTFELRFINHCGHMSHGHFVELLINRFEVVSMRYMKKVLFNQILTAMHQ